MTAPPDAAPAEPCVCRKPHGQKCCDAESNRFLCTRPAGHDGDHVACGRGCDRLATWPQAQR